MQTKNLLAGTSSFPLLPSGTSYEVAFKSLTPLQLEATEMQLFKIANV